MNQTRILCFVGIVCVSWSHGFVPTPTFQNPSTLFAAKSSSAWSAPARLSHEEQRVLLFQTFEKRRIVKVSAELKTRKPVTSLQISRAVGYGDELVKFDEALESGEEARERLITTNMGLVYHCVNEIARKRKLQSVTREDLIQEGAIGLARAVDRWNPEFTGKFSTYAYYWIRAAVLRGIAEKDDAIRVPEHVNSAVSKISKVDGLWQQESAWKEAAAARALAEAAGVTDRQFQEAMKVKERRNTGMLSFESYMQNGITYETNLATEDIVYPVDASQMKQTLSRYLRPNEMEALSWRYGLNDDNNNDKTASAQAGRWGEAMSFVEVGKQMKVSAEYGRRLCHAALEKLRSAAEEGTLEPAILGA